MTNLKCLYETQESLFAKHLQSKEWIEYSIHIKIMESGKQPVIIEMNFVPPHPFVMNMPDRHLVKAENLSAAFTKIVKYLKRMGFELG